MRFLPVFVVALVATILGGCGEDDKGTSTSSGGTSSSSGDPPNGGSTSGDTDAGAAAQSAGPKITQVMKMTGSLHVTWELPEKCDGVELERKDGDAEYKLAYELPGTVDNKHDGTATKDMVYTYRARCKVGSEYSEYSNEMSKNPL